MNNITYSFLISGIAGFATVIGTIVIFFCIKNDRSVGYFLSFATGAMISLSVLDLVPKAINYANKYFKFIPSFVLVLLFTIIGILMAFLLDAIVPKAKHSSGLLFRTGILSMLVLIMHNIPEGIATFITCTSNLTFGIALSLVITIHNIPEGISIAVPIYYSTKSKLKALFYTFIAGFSELIGAFIAYVFLSSSILEIHFSFLFSIIAGMMLYISFYELLPTAYLYCNNKYLLIKPFVFGTIIMLLYHVIFG